MLSTDREHRQLGHRQNVRSGAQVEVSAIRGKNPHNLPKNVRSGTQTAVRAKGGKCHRNLDLHDIPAQLQRHRRLHRRRDIALKSIDIRTNTKSKSIGA